APLWWRRQAKYQPAKGDAGGILVLAVLNFGCIAGLGKSEQ
ncbi:unnamed protein product, partial [marine sediment metagenome]